MTAQEECLRRYREAHDELVEEVRKAAIELSDARLTLQRASKDASIAEANFDLAINALKQYKGDLQ